MIWEYTTPPALRPGDMLIFPKHSGVTEITDESVSAVVVVDSTPNGTGADLTLLDGDGCLRTIGLMANFMLMRVKL